MTIDIGPPTPNICAWCNIGNRGKLRRATRVELVLPGIPGRQNPLNSMHTEHIRIRIGPSGRLPHGQRPGLLQKLVGTLAAILLLVGAFMISVVVLAVVATAGLVGGAYLWWKTRELRRQLRERARARPPGGRALRRQPTRPPRPRQLCRWSRGSCAEWFSPRASGWSTPSAGRIGSPGSPGSRCSPVDARVLRGG